MIYVFLYLIGSVIVFILEYWGLCYNYSTLDKVYKNNYSFSEYMEEYWGPIITVALFWLPIIMLTPLWLLGLIVYFSLKKIRKYYNID